MSKGKGTRERRLVFPAEHFNKNSISDLLVILMANVEDALLESGAIPHQDYNRLDLFKAATPFVVSMFEDTTNPLTFVIDYESDKFFADREARKP